MTQKPTDQLLESLSAMVDDEAGELELRRILKSLDDDGTALEHWHRYQLVGAAIRKETHIDCSKSLLNSITAAIDSEDSKNGFDAKRELVSSNVAGSKVNVPSQVFQPKWKSLMGQSMIAASIAAAFVVSFGYLSEPTNINGLSPHLAESSQLDSAGHVVADSVPIGFDLPLPEARVVSGGNVSAPSVQTKSVQRLPVQRYVDDLSDLATQQMLDGLLIEHAGRSSVNGSLGFMPFARVSKMSEGE